MSSTVELAPDSTSGSESDAYSDSEPITPQYLESLLQKAREAAASSSRSSSAKDGVREQEDIVLLLSDQPKNQRSSFPVLDPGPSFPRPYFELGGSSRGEGSSSSSALIRDTDAEAVQRSAPSQPASAPPPPELDKDGKRLTKRQKKEQKKSTAGPDWFDLPAPAAAELPGLYREVEAIRLRNALDPKRFYRKEEGEGKGIKGLPKHFAIGTIIPESTPFGTPSADNLSKAHRKRTVVDELMDDAEARRYAKKKFLDLQVVRGERGRGTLAKKAALRRKKW